MWGGWSWQIPLAPPEMPLPSFTLIISSLKASYFFYPKLSPRISTHCFKRPINLKYRVGQPNLDLLLICNELNSIVATKITTTTIIANFRSRKINLGTTALYPVSVPSAEGKPPPREPPSRPHPFQSLRRAAIIGEIDMKLVGRVIESHGRQHSVHDIFSGLLGGVCGANEDIHRRKKLDILRQSFREHGSGKWTPTVGCAEDPNEGEDGFWWENEEAR